MVLIDMRGKQKFDWEARNSTSYWFKLILTFGCNVGVSLASRLRLGWEFVYNSVSLSWLSH